MKISEVLKISMTFIGTIIGAGFASGREIALYFKEQSYLAPVVAGVLIGFFCFVFAELGRLSKNEEMLSLLFPKTHKPAKIFIELANYVTFIAMIAGAELILNETFHIVGGGIFSALLAFGVLLKGNNGMKLLNTVIVPVIVVAVVGLGIKADSAVPQANFFPLSSLSYASMNLLTGGYLIGSLTKERTAKENLLISVIVATVTTLLLTLIFKIVLLEKDAAMPIGAFASKLNLKFVSGVLIYLAILTTMASSLKVSAGTNIYKSFLALSFGFVFSLIGFESLVDRFYPIIGYAGVLLSAVALYRLLRLKLSICFIKRKKRKDAFLSLSDLPSKKRRGKSFF